MEYARQGGRVLFLAGEAAEGADLIGPRTLPLQPAESWRMASGIAWADAAPWPWRPFRADLGWRATGFFPHHLFDAGSLGPADRQLAGWFEGWLANAGAFVVERQVGQGRVLATTFRFDRQYGLERFATLLLNRLVELCRVSESSACIAACPRMPVGLHRKGAPRPGPSPVHERGAG